MDKELKKGVSMKRATTGSTTHENVFNITENRGFNESQSSTTYKS